MSKLLLISPRQGAQVAAEELADYRQHTGVGEDLDQIVIDSTDVTIGDVSEYAGIMIGGSPFNVCEEERTELHTHIDTQLLDLVERTDKPLLFICYGFGLLAAKKGGTASRDYPEEAGEVIISLTDAAATDPLMDGLPQQFSAMTGHKENAHSLPEDWVLLATGENCPLQMARMGEHVWMTQYHPEETPEALLQRMTHYRHSGYFPPGGYEKIQKAVTGVDTSASNSVLRRFTEYALSHAAAAQ